MKLVSVVALVLLLLIGAGPVMAQGEVSASSRAERERIDRARAAAEARFKDRERECLTRFIATSCVDDAKRERRETVTRLKHEQMAFEEKERKEQAAARVEAIRRKTEAASTRSAEPAAREVKEPRPDRPPRAARGRADGVDAPASAPPRERPGKSLLPKPQAKENTRSVEDVARKQSAFEAAQRAAEQHRAEVEARNAARAVKKKPAAPLPLPPGAAAP